MFAKGMKVRVVDGRHKGNRAVVELLSQEEDYNTKVKTDVLILRFENSNRMAKVYPHEVSRDLDLGKSKLNRN